MDLSVLLDQKFIAITIFLATYIYIASGRTEKQIATMVGAVFVWITGILSSSEVIGYIDFDTLGLLFGMMVIVGGLREAGFFQYVGLGVAKISKYIPLRMFIYLTLTTALLSALLANVTVVLFMTIIIIELAELLKIDPTPFIMGEILASNIGGSATLIGDPPNIMIAIQTKMTFLDFIIYIAPISIVSLFFMIILLYFIYRDKLGRKKIIGELPLKPREVLKDLRLLYTSWAIFIFTITLFFIKDLTNLTYSSIAIIGASILLLTGGKKMTKVLDDVEWGTLIFLTGLFIIIGGLNKTGIIHDIAEAIKPYLTLNEMISLSIVVWLSASLSAIIANIPFTAAFIPILKEIAGSSPENILWWALILGADLGGNATPIGSSSNVVALDIANERGYDISFANFFKIGFIIFLITIGVSNALLIARHILGI